MDHNLQLLGIAKKAGYLAVGGEAASAAARSGKAVLIIAAADASDNAKRRAKRDSEFCGAAYAAAPYTRFELGSITGRGSPGIIALLDTGLASTFIGGLASIDPAGYSGTAEILAERHRRRLSSAKRTGSGERQAANSAGRTGSGERQTANSAGRTGSGERQTANAAGRSGSGERQTANSVKHTISGKRRTAL